MLAAVWVVQTVYGCAALALLVPVFFLWYPPVEDEEESSQAWASSGLSWQSKLQLVAFCAFEVLLAVQLCSCHHCTQCMNPSVDH